MSAVKHMKRHQKHQLKPVRIYICELSGLLGLSGLMLDILLAKVEESFDPKSEVKEFPCKSHVPCATFNIPRQTKEVHAPP